MQKYNNTDIVSKELVPGTHPCPHCISSDAFRIYEKVTKDGKLFHDATCFSCKRYDDNPPGFETTSAATVFAKRNTNEPIITSAEKHVSLFPKPHSQDVLSDFKIYPHRALLDRSLTKQTCEHYDVRVTLSETNGEPVTHMYPYFKQGKFSGYKQRVIATKQMFSVGDCTTSDLFGTHVVKPNGKTLYITEGELDCLALYQVLRDLSGLPGWEPSVVSLSHGAASAAKDISNSIDFVDSFEKIVLCFDMDDPGKAAAEDACKILAGKVYIASYSEKDANEMLLKGKADELKWDVLKHARMYMPDSIVNYADCWERYKEGKNQTCYAWPPEWKEMNQKTYGIRLGELVTITSGCVDKDTEFMTPLGWKKISEYFEGDDVLQYHADGSTSYTKPLAYINKPCDKLWSIQNKYGISQTLSDEHRVIYYTDSGVLKEKTLEEVRHLHDRQVTGFRGRIKTSFTAPEMPGFNLGDSEIRLQVAIHADGYIHGKKIRINLKKQRKKDRLRDLLRASNIEWKEHNPESAPGFTSFSFYPPILSKNYGSEWYSCTNSQLKVIVDEVLYWDGNEVNSFYTTIKSDADFIQYCFTSQGKRASLSTTQREGRKSTDYVVIISECDLISFRKTTTSQPKFKEVVPEDGRKYCFTVDTGMLVLRKDGNIFITGNSGSGKSQLMRELKYHYHETTDFKFADIALEEDVGDSMAGLIALRLNQRVTLPDVKIDEHLEKEAFEYFFNSRRWTGYDYFGGLDNDNLFSKIRFFAATGHKIIFLDHLSIIVSEFASDGGERERIDTIMTKLAKMVKELNITIFLIVHLKKTQDKPFEEGYVPTLDDLRGSGSLKQLSWMVIALTRNQQHEDSFCANTSELTVLKCRFTGRTGTADYLHFNDKTGRMAVVPRPQNYRPAKKGFKPNFSVTPTAY